MTTFTQFAVRCKMRHDFADRIQVRYHHPGGEYYDTWVSGDEIEGRLRSEQVEERLRRLGRLNWEEIREAGKQLPAEGKRRLQAEIEERLADNVEDFLGESLLGQSLAEIVGGDRSDEDERECASGERERWQGRLHDDNFRSLALELAWINLRGSFPEEDEDADFDDWV